MSIPEKTIYISREEYLEGEKISPIKHEYIRGQVFAMSGTTKVHNRIAFNSATLLQNVLQNEACEVYIADVKVWVEAADTYYYPDVVVTCDVQVEPVEDEYVIYHPRLIVEVLSRSNEAYDRGDKFRDYGTLDSLEDYLLVEQGRMSVDCYHRSKGQDWQHRNFGAGDEIYFPGLEASLKVDELYARVNFGRPVGETSTTKRPDVER